MRYMPGRLFVCVHACVHLFVMYTGPPCTLNTVRIDTERERAKDPSLDPWQKLKKKNQNVLVVE